MTNTEKTIFYREAIHIIHMCIRTLAIIYYVRLRERDLADKQPNPYWQRSLSLCCPLFVQDSVGPHYATMHITATMLCIAFRRMPRPQPFPRPNKQ